MKSLSGGNQQKVVVAREFSRPLRVLIASQPTRGVDVGSIEFIHKRIISERDKGTAVIIVSTELDEVFALADRIAVMYDGRIVGTVVARHSPRGHRTHDGWRPRTRDGRCRVSENQAKGSPRRRSRARTGEKRGSRDLESWLPTVVDSVAAIFLALIVGAFLIMFSTPRVIESLQYIFSYPADFFSYSARRCGTATRHFSWARSGPVRPGSRPSNALRRSSARASA